MNRLRIIGLLAVLALQWGCTNNTPSTPTASEVSFSYPFNFQFGDYGIPGSGPGQFNNPWGCLVYNNALFIADFSNSRVQKFDLSGNFLASYTLNSIAGPTDLAVGKNGVIYVTDWTNNNVQTMDVNGNYINTLGSSGSGLGQFSEPAGIATDSSGRIYVSENSNNRIQRCDPTNMPSSCVTVGGTAAGSGNFQFSHPYGIHVDASWYVFVADYGNNRIQKFGPTLYYQATIGSSGSGQGQLNGPNDVTEDANGSLIVTEWGNARIQKLSATGIFKQFIGTGKFTIPMYATFDPANHLYVTDYSGHAVDVFNPN